MSLIGQLTSEDIKHHFIIIIIIRDIELLNAKLQDSEYCILGLKRELSRVQSDLRHKNVKIDGIKEDVGETASGLVNKVAQTLNTYYTESVLTK